MLMQQHAKPCVNYIIHFLIYITAYWFMHTLHVVLTTHGNNYKIVLIYPILFIYLIYNYVIHMSSV